MATPLSTLDWAGAGAGATRQAVPFQCSISALRLSPAALRDPPTAHASADDRLATPLSRLSVGGLGIWAMAQPQAWPAWTWLTSRMAPAAAPPGAGPPATPPPAPATRAAIVKPPSDRPGHGVLRPAARITAAAPP